MTTTTSDPQPDRRESTPTARTGARVVAALVAFVLVAQCAGLAGIPFTERAVDSWYDQLDRPFFNPPSWVFAPVWTTLYTLIGVAAWLVWRTERSAARSRALTCWSVQLVLNAAWTPLFFGAQLPWVALAEIVLLVGAVSVTIAWFRQVDARAAWLMAPYLGWVLYASLLTRRSP